MGKNNKPKKLLWLDLEMTGLDPEKDRILEVAIIITDFDFKELAIYEAVIKQDEETLSNMSPWAKEHLGANGLIDKIKQNGREEDEVVDEIVELVNKNFDQPAVLAGNSIHQDRRFIRKWWPLLDEKLHYRMLDVSSFKVLMQGRYGQEFRKPDEHIALEDIRGSIQELGYYFRKLPKFLEDAEGAAE